VLVASRYPQVTFAISLAGPIVGMIEDRLYAQMNGLRDRGTTDEVVAAITPLWEKSFRAWASGDPRAHDAVHRDIAEWRKKYPRSILPATKQEMEMQGASEFERVLSTWRSLPNDYLSELARFRKKWLAIFGAIDRVVPTDASARNIVRYMALSGNKDYAVAVIPRCGHTPVDVETKRRIRFENLALNWIDDNVVALDNHAHREGSG
jgi:pimeloyl-ACP methyl ester carboxylesterase